jgi:glycosyltransferase involved in cell wall biosynthesis
MKIGVNTLFLIPGEVGGSETYLVETLRELLKLPDGDEWVLFTNQENHAPLAGLFGGNPRVRLQPLNVSASNRPARILAEQTRLPLAARRASVDLLWSPGYTMPLSCPGCVQVLSVLDMQYKRHPDDLSTAARFATNLLVQAGVRRAARVLAISEFSKAEIVRFTGIPDDRIVVTPLAAGDDFLAQPRPSAHRDTPRLLCIANTYPHKNVAALARASGVLAADFPHHLVLVGKPRRGEETLRKELSACAPGNVTRVSGLSRPELIRRLQDADLFVFPSLYEGFGLPVLEAMVAGTTVLTTRCGAIPEVGGDAVDYFDPSDPADLPRRIREVLARRPEERADRIARAQERARRFNWRTTAERTIRAFHQAARQA